MREASLESWNDDVLGEEVPKLINSDAQNLIVEAGPGAGKTFGLVRRVERILHPDGMNVSGKDVLVVAFNRVIAKGLAADIEERLDHIGFQGDRPIIRTVHALCLEAVKQEFRLLLPLEREAMIYDVLELFPSLRQMYDYKSARQSLRDHEAGHAVHTALWQACQRWLIRHRAQLISELPNLLLNLLKTGSFGKLYRHVLVDEFQDLTAGEQELFRRIVEPDGNFVALGDPRQSIYAFRGNDREGLEKIARELAAETLVLEECQRCPISIVNAANELMALSTSAPLKPTSTESGEIEVVHWGTPQEELKGMAKAIVVNIRAYPSERHLVMTTRRQFGLRIRNEIAKLAGEDIDIELTLSEGLLETWPVREAFLFLCLLFDPDPATWRAWFAYGNSTTQKPVLSPKRNANAYLNFLTACKDQITHDAVTDLAQRTSGRELGQGGSTLVDRAKRYVELYKAVDTSIEGEELLRDLLSDDRWSRAELADLDAVLLDLSFVREQAVALFTESTADNRGQDAVRHLRYAIATREPFKKDVPITDVKRPVVQISTLWSAKGVTTENAYVVGLCGEAIPGMRRTEYPGTDDDFREEQRRLFYVTITRTKKRLVLSRPTKIRRGDARQLGLFVKGTEQWPQLKASTFLTDIQAFLPDSVEGKDWLQHKGL